VHPRAFLHAAARGVIAGILEAPKWGPGGGRAGIRGHGVRVAAGWTDRFRVNDSVVFRELDQEAVLLDLQNGVYFGLDAVGTRVWTLLIEHGTPEQVCARMIEEYDVSPQVLRDDVLRLVEELADKGLVVADAEGHAAP
jgi:hypothetical protein